MPCWKTAPRPQTPESPWAVARLVSLPRPTTWGSTSVRCPAALLLGLTHSVAGAEMRINHPVEQEYDLVTAPGGGQCLPPLKTAAIPTRAIAGWRKWSRFHFFGPEPFHPPGWKRHADAFAGTRADTVSPRAIRRRAAVGGADERSQMRATLNLSPYLQGPVETQLGGVTMVADGGSGREPGSGLGCPWLGWR